MAKRVRKMRRSGGASLRGNSHHLAIRELCGRLIEAIEKDCALSPKPRKSLFTAAYKLLLFEGIIWRPPNGHYRVHGKHVLTEYGKKHIRLYGYNLPNADLTND